MSQTASGFATPSLNWASEGLPDEFRSFRRYCELVFTGPYAKLSEKEKVTYVLLWIGRHGLDVYNAWSWEHEADKHKLTPLWERFENHIEPKVNSFLARNDFHQCRQKEEESVDEFISRLRVIAGKCKLTPAELPVRLVEQLIIATKHVEVQSKLLEKGDKLDLALLWTLPKHTRQ